MAGKPSLKEFGIVFFGHWSRSVTGGAGLVSTFVALGGGWDQDTKLILLGAGILAFAIAAFMTWGAERKARNTSEEIARPRLKLIAINQRREVEVYGNLTQEFTLKIQNIGLKPLGNCLVKVESIEGRPDHIPTALTTYYGGHTPSSAFNLRGHETKEIFFSRNKFSAGDTFLTVDIAYEVRGYSYARSLDPSRESELLLGLYSEVAPTFVRLKLIRNDEGLLEVIELPQVG